VCNLGSVNLRAAPERTAQQLDHDKLQDAPIRTAMRMLDNVIDINYYAVKKARDSNLRHRPVGLGIMGFQDCLYELRVPYASARGGRVRRPLDGGGRATTPTGPRPSWPQERGRYSQLQGLAVGPRHPAAGLAATCSPRSAAATSRSTSSVTLDWDALRARIARARHAQLQLRGDRADRDHLQHHRRRRLDRADLPATCTSSPTSRASSPSSTSTSCATSRSSGLWDERDGGRPEALRRLAASRSTACPTELRALYATAFEVDPAWLVEAARAPPEVDRPGAVAQHLHGRRLGQEAATRPTSWPGCAA
jgi:ribonucleoside-diphosphate reductase alpha chain